MLQVSQRRISSVARNWSVTMDLLVILHAFCCLSPVFILLLSIVSGFQIMKTSLFPLRYGFRLSLFNGSCSQKWSQLHPWLCIPAVPFTSDPAMSTFQRWLAKLGGKRTHWKNRQTKPQTLISAVVKQGDRNMEQGQTAGGSADCFF